MKLIGDLITVIVGVCVMFAGVAGFILVWALLWALPTWLLWNWLMPDLFGLTTITIWQAIGINLLSGILFKSKHKSEKKEKKKEKKKEILFG